MTPWTRFAPHTAAVLLVLTLVGPAHPGTAGIGPQRAIEALKALGFEPKQATSFAPGDTSTARCSALKTVSRPSGLSDEFLVGVSLYESGEALRAALGDRLTAPPDVDAGPGVWAKATRPEKPTPGYRGSSIYRPESGAVVDFAVENAFGTVRLRVIGSEMRIEDDDEDRAKNIAGIESLRLREEALSSAASLARGLVDALLAPEGTEPLEKIVRNYVLGGNKVAGIFGDAVGPEEQLAAWLKTIVDASVSNPSGLADCLFRQLEDREVGPGVFRVVTGRLLEFQGYPGGSGNPLILENLRARLPREHPLLRYVRAKEREDKSALEDMIREWQMAHKVALLALDLGLVLGGAGSPGTLANSGVPMRGSAPDKRTT